jgi:hypothetical protein
VIKTCVNIVHEAGAFMQGLVVEESGCDLLLQAVCADQMPHQITDTTQLQSQVHAIIRSSHHQGKMGFHMRIIEK